MAQEKVKKPRKKAITTGRTKHHADIELIKNLASIGCTVSEMAIALNVSQEWFYKNKEAMEAYHSGLNEIRTSLRREQLKAILNGNTTMLIWMGKQLLNQRDFKTLAEEQVKNDVVVD